MEIIVHDCAEIIIYHIHYNRLLRLSKAIKSCIYRNVAMRKKTLEKRGKKSAEERYFISSEKRYRAAQECSKRALDRKEHVLVFGCNILGRCK